MSTELCLSPDTIPATDPLPELKLVFRSFLTFPDSKLVPTATGLISAQYYSLTNISGPGLLAACPGDISSNSPVDPVSRSI